MGGHSVWCYRGFEAGASWWGERGWLLFVILAWACEIAIASTGQAAYLDRRQQEGEVPSAMLPHRRGFSTRFLPSGVVRCKALANA
jgi:hypothetical protein